MCHSQTEWSLNQGIADSEFLIGSGNHPKRSASARGIQIWKMHKQNNKNGVKTHSQKVH